MFIYRITNKINGKHYVGQTVTPIKKRWALHRFQSERKNRPLYASMRKHGLDAFEMVVLEELPATTGKLDLDAREIYWIAELNCMHPSGYNMTSGGFGRYSLSQETKRKISASRIRAPRPPEVIAKMRLAAMGNTSKRGSKLSAESRARISQSQIGKKVSDETKAKMSASHASRQIYNAKQVQCIETGVIYKSTGEAARSMGLQQTSISAVCLGKRKITGGFSFKFP